MPSTPRSIALLLVLASASITALAQEAPDPSCAALAKTTIPPSHISHGKSPDPQICNSWGIYYKSGNSIQHEDALNCALAERRDAEEANSDPSETNLTYAVLTMIYADGKGVAPNLKLAARFACQLQGREGYDIRLVKMLNSKRLQSVTKVDFNICDGFSTLDIVYACLTLDERKTAVAIIAVGDRLNAGGDAQQRTAFNRVLTARKAYLDAHDGEQGTGTSDIVQGIREARYELEVDWLKSLNDFAAGKLPNFTDQDFATADAELNADYQQTRKSTLACDSDLCTQANQLQKVERIWLVYREAWVGYAKLRWPSVSADNWRTWLTRDRTSELSAVE
jgi:hypothetical protein